MLEREVKALLASAADELVLDDPPELVREPAAAAAPFLGDKGLSLLTRDDMATKQQARSVLF